MINATAVKKIDAWRKCDRQVRIRFTVVTRDGVRTVVRNVVEVATDTGWIHVRFQGCQDFVVKPSEVSRVVYL